jgi:pimeloyl-ACP methyl ester carboxylesterase
MSRASSTPSTEPRATPQASTEAGVLGALALATEYADELVLGTVRDVHGAVSQRVRGAIGLAAGMTGPDQAQRRTQGVISGAVYAGIDAGLRVTTQALRAADRRGVGGRLEATHQGRFALAAVNALIGDRLADDAPDMAIEMGVRLHGADVPLDPEHVAEAFPEATPDLVVFVHGLGESAGSWNRDREETGGSYGERLQADLGWTPVYLRANTGLPITQNGVMLAGLLDDLVAAWPTKVRRIALVGHSMGGLIIRSACAVVTDAETQWNTLVTNVVTLGTPHLGAPLEQVVNHGARVLGLIPESAPFGRILEYRSVGILDLRAGLAPDVQSLPHARYHLVGATLAGSRRHPVSQVLGDMLVRYPSATGRSRRGQDMFPGADTLHIRGGHFDLLNHPEVYDALRAWLSGSSDTEETA